MCLRLDVELFCITLSSFGCTTLIESVHYLPFQENGSVQIREYKQYEGSPRVASYMYVQSSKSDVVVSYILCGLSPAVFATHQTLIDSTYATHPLCIATILYYVAALKQNERYLGK